MAASGIYNYAPGLSGIPHKLTRIQPGTRVLPLRSLPLIMFCRLKSTPPSLFSSLCSFHPVAYRSFASSAIMSNTKAFFEVEYAPAGSSARKYICIFADCDPHSPQSSLISQTLYACTEDAISLAFSQQASM